MERQYFGTDGIRGTVGLEPITPDFVLRLAYAVGCILKREEVHPTVVIGKDTRISGYMLESALESGFSSAGVDVVLLGPLPTPGVAYLTRALRANLGVVISASHNPFADNGIKFFSATGSKLPDEWETEVESLLAQPPRWVDSSHLGRARRLDDAAGRYIEFCKNTFPHQSTLKGLKVVVDAANGAAYHIAPKVFHELGAEVTAIGVVPDGFNINQGVGATHLQALVEAVKARGADIGIALDGDGDRLMCADDQGRVYNGDELLYVLAMDRLQQGENLPGIVGTLMTNMAIEQALATYGLELVRAKVGDRYVLEALQDRRWFLGGESSGHLLILDKHTTGDGLISALQVLQASIRQGKSLPELMAGVSLFPQTMINVRLQTGADWAHNANLIRRKEQVEQTLGENGRVLIRASGTEPLLRIMVEARDTMLAQQAAQDIAATLQ